jgi:hypothetical protein
MIRQRNSTIWHKANGALRLGIARGYQPFSQYPLVNEYPKSGGSWLAQMLSDALELPFPRNRLPMLGSSIMHGHYRLRHVAKPCSIVWRDGRDVAVSFYFHRVIGNAHTPPELALATQKKLGITDPNNVVEYLPRFIELLAQGGTHPGYSWARFVEEWHGSSKVCCEVKYEDMLTDSAEILLRTCETFGYSLTETKAREISEKYSFKSQAGRVSGDEDQSSYLRKGIAGDWREKFSKESSEVFAHFMGDALISLDYEKDNSWINLS